MHFSTLLAIVLRVALLRSSWRSCLMRAAPFIMRATNSSLVFNFSLDTSLFIHPHRKNLICTRKIQTAVSSHPMKIGQIFTYLFGTVHTTTSQNIYIPLETSCIIRSMQWQRCKNVEIMTYEI